MGIAPSLIDFFARSRVLWLRNSWRELIDALAVEQVGWKEYANCLGAHHDLFFPDRGASTRAAKQICAECQVRVDCLEYAVTRGEKFGIWGGLSERELREIRKQRAAEALQRVVS